MEASNAVEVFRALGFSAFIWWLVVTQVVNPMIITAGSVLGLYVARRAGFWPGATPPAEK